MSNEINIADFAAFCRSKGGGTYEYVDNCGCAVAQFVADRDGRPVFVFPQLVEYMDGDRERFSFSEEIEAAVNAYDDHDDNKRSFAGLADRLEALIAEPVS